MNQFSNQFFKNGFVLYQESELVNKLIVFIHGYGANALGVQHLINYLGGSSKNTLFAGINAPYRRSDDDFAFDWFPIQESIRTMSYSYLYTHCMQNLSLINQQIQHWANQYSIDTHNIYYVGFSQGGFMGLFGGLHQALKVGHIISIGGGLAGLSPELIQQASQLQPSNAPSFVLMHGERDTVVPMDFFHNAVDFLRQRNLPLTTCLSPTAGHYMDDILMESLKAYVVK